MSTKKQVQQDAYLQKLLGRHAVPGYHASVVVRTSCTLQEKVVPTVPSSNRRSSLGDRN